MVGHEDNDHIIKKDEQGRLYVQSIKNIVQDDKIEVKEEEPKKRGRKKVNPLYQRDE
jgi:hypothetical protein